MFENDWLNWVKTYFFIRSLMYFTIIFKMLITYKYILELQHVENGEYSIIHIFSPTSTSLDNQKCRKNTIIF
jgi:hypothetical protein